ncbi:AraC family transcriptional regulator [Cohnella sp. JJ-181]|uniref:AraC family transcriptional regulator n=1 Tax=Cohnella rhizoplanae TaxID=2974897 RepID=UPI0022FF9134|nr:AraC family transcriptional regulator [Cohnella sp. JJ-181]CAI6052541.1 HTH-type transcriptional activator RhaS [Cohnella sp. JJ-181]
MHPLNSISYDDVTGATAGSVVYPPGGRFGPRVQQDIQLVMLYTGEMHVTIGDRSLSLSPGQGLLLKPGHEETFVFSRTEETWHRWIAVSTGRLDDACLRALHVLPEALPLTEEMNRLTDLMLKLQQHVTEAGAPVIRSLGLAALHLFPYESVRFSRQQEKHPAVYSAIDWIRGHFAENITLPSLAARAGVSPEHLLRLFKKHEGATPIQYLWRFRIARAIDLLAHTGITVSEVAERCGFKTSHHFARMLKQDTGKTAKEIRRSAWSDPR